LLGSARVGPRSTADRPCSLNRRFLTRALAIPTALLASACGATERWVPPSSAASAWNEVPLPLEVAVPSASEAGAHWILPAENPWAAYQKTTLLSSLSSLDPSVQHFTELPRVAELDVVIEAEQAARVVANVGLPEDTMWMVDLRGAASVAFGATLSAHATQAVAPITTFNNWPAAYELVPAEETLAALVTMEPRLPAHSEAGQPVFLLDAWRLAYRDQEPDDEVTDNRYMLTPADFPDPATLLARGIHQVLYVVESLAKTTTEEDDLQQTLLAYQRAGITVSMVDLGWLARTEDPARWDERLREVLLRISPDRITVVDDPSFYVRAHGGFGGLHVYGGGHHPGGGWGMGRGPGGGGRGGHGGG